jgi:hypothetical protein
MLKRKNKKIRGQRGIGLVETLMAVAILGTAVVTFVAGLATGAVSVRLNDQDATAQRLAQSEMEYIKNSAFSAAGSYGLITVPANYTVQVTAAAAAGTDSGLNIQKITINVLAGGSSIYTLTGYKTNR